MRKALFKIEGISDPATLINLKGNVYFKNNFMSSNFALTSVYIARGSIHLKFAPVNIPDPLFGQVDYELEIPTQEKVRIIICQTIKTGVFRYSVIDTVMNEYSHCRQFRIRSAFTKTPPKNNIIHESADELAKKMTHWQQPSEQKCGSETVSMHIFDAAK